MLIIPAIDLKNGKCVRLFQGRPNAETVFSNDPVEVAQRWESQGASRLHIVDLDGAFSGSPANLPIVKEILTHINIPVQLGGGIRDSETISTIIDAGIEKVIIGTRAAQDKEFLNNIIQYFGNKIIIGVDARDGKVAIKGWQETLSLNVTEFVEELASSGVNTIIYTDINRDGTLLGPNINSITKILNKGVEVINAGGMSKIADIEALIPLYDKGLIGTILGKALYTGAINLQDAISLAANRSKETK